MASKFGQLLLWGNLITREQLEQALEYQRSHGGRLGEILSHLGHISSDDVTRTLGMKYGVPTVNLDLLRVDPEILALVPAGTARAHRIVPLSRMGSTLTCAMEDPTRFDAINEVEFQTGCHLLPVLVTATMMSAALERYYPAAPASNSSPQSPARPAKAVFVAQLSERLTKLSPEKLEYIRRFIDAIE